MPPPLLSTQPINHQILNISFFLIFLFFFKFILFIIYFWLCWVFAAACGLFSGCGEWGLLFVAVCGLLIAVASLVEHGLQGRGLQQLWRMGFSSCGSWALECRLSSCGTWAQLLRGMWDLPRPGLEPVSPALAGGFLTTAPPGKPSLISLLLAFLVSIQKHLLPISSY